MEKIKLKLGEILQLGHEINGFINPENGQKEYDGFLKQDISIILKYELSELGESLEKEKKKVDGLRDELIKKYGQEENGSLVVKMFIDELDEEGNLKTRQINPKYIEFDKEFGELLNQQKEIEYPTITKQDLKDAGKTKDNYKILFKLVKKD